MNWARSIRPKRISRSPKNSSTAMNKTPTSSIVGGAIPKMLAARKFARLMR